MIGTINNRNKLILTLYVFTQTPGILSKNEFRTFWIKTTATTISVGRGGETAPFMIYSLEKSNPSIKYVAFSSWGPHSGQWEILPHNIQFTTNGYKFKYYSKSAVTDLQAGRYFKNCELCILAVTKQMIKKHFKANGNYSTLFNCSF